MDLFAAPESISYVTVALVKTFASFDNITRTVIDCKQMIVASMSS
jgi:hypothetical protein